MKHTDKLLEIFTRHGLNVQKRKFAEESFELIEALTEYECDIQWEDYDARSVSCDKAAITEELADCIVLLRQFIAFFKIPEEEIEKWVDFKINRTLERMNDGKEKDNTKGMG